MSRSSWSSSWSWSGSQDPTSHFDGWDLKNDHFGTLFGPFLRGPKQVSSTPIRTWQESIAMDAWSVSPSLMVVGLGQTPQKPWSGGGRFLGVEGSILDPPLLKWSSLYILSRARVEEMVGKMTLFGPFSGHAWPRNGGVFDHPFPWLNGNAAQKWNFTCSKHDTENDCFVFLQKKSVFWCFFQNHYFPKKAKKGNSVKTRKVMFLRGATTKEHDDR